MNVDKCSLNVKCYSNIHISNIHITTITLDSLDSSRGRTRHSSSDMPFILLSLILKLISLISLFIQIQLIYDCLKVQKL